MKAYYEIEMQTLIDNYVIFIETSIDSCFPIVLIEALSKANLLVG